MRALPNLNLKTTSHRFALGTHYTKPERLEEAIYAYRRCLLLQPTFVGRTS